MGIADCNSFFSLLQMENILHCDLAGKKNIAASFFSARFLTFFSFSARNLLVTLQGRDRFVIKVISSISLPKRGHIFFVQKNSSKSLLTSFFGTCFCYRLLVSAILFL